MAKKLITACFLLGAVFLQPTALAHDVAGQPTHVLNEDPNAPPAVQVETHTGPYHVNLMASPASPKPDERGTLTLSVYRSENGQPFIGKVTFKALDNSMFFGKAETIGIQYIRDDVYQQSFLFKEAGDYVIRAEFEADGEMHGVGLPLTIGTPSSLGIIGAVITVLLIALVSVNLVQRRRLQQLRAAA